MPSSALKKKSIGRFLKHMWRSPLAPEQSGDRGQMSIHGEQARQQLTQRTINRAQFLWKWLRVFNYCIQATRQLIQITTRAAQRYDNTDQVVDERQHNDQ